MGTIPFSRKRTGTTDKPLPHNADAERAVLGALLLDNKLLPSVLNHLSEQDFFLNANRIIFQAICRLAVQGAPADLISVADSLETEGKLLDVGNHPYLASLLDALPSKSHVAHHAYIIHRLALRRRLVYSYESNLERALGREEGEEDLIAETERLATYLRTELTRTINGNGHLSVSTQEFLQTSFQPCAHLVEQLIPVGGSIMLYALPHHLKSWFTIALAYGSTLAGKLLGVLEVKRPVRTILAQIEDPSNEFQKRVTQLLNSEMFFGIDHSLVRTIDRSRFRAGDMRWVDQLLREIDEFRIEHVILDVLRRLFPSDQDVNSPKDSAKFVESLDRLREHGCAVTLVHHANKKLGELGELLLGAAGSYNWTGWANTVVQFKNKEDRGDLTSVLMAVDGKFAQSPEPMRLTLDLKSGIPLYLTPLKEELTPERARERLSDTWTVRAFMEEHEMSRPSVYRWISAHRQQIEKIGGTGKGGRGVRGAAVYRFIESPPEN